MPSDYSRIRAENLEEYGHGVRHLEFFRRLYADRTHFIFEILQNAEDARATRVEFDLQAEALEIRHDGRPFNEADVRGVCGIDEGTGKGDLTRIGKFGVGFKSVYAYTESPEIHSGDEHFRIDQFIRPSEIPAIDVGEETVIRLPFNRSDETSPGVATGEIRHGLDSLAPTSLLFLKSIARIRVIAADKHTVELRRETDTDGSHRDVRLFRDVANDESLDSRWFVFEKLTHHTSTTERLRVEAGFRMNGEGVIPVERSPLVVFFPTEKDTRLGFLIQGPYRTTPARDNVPADDEWNQFLVGETASLAAETLQGLKDLEVLNPDSLSAFPIDESEFLEGEFFRPIFESVRDALNARDLIPATADRYVSGQNAKLARSAAVRELFSDEQLAQITGNARARWLSGEITSDRTPALHEYLTEVLEIEELTPRGVVERLDPEFIERVTDDWLIRLYQVLGETPSLWRFRTGPVPLLHELPIIRLETGRHVAPLSTDGKPNAYLAPPGDTEFPIVKRAISFREEAREFLQEIGLREPDIVAEVMQFVVPRYQSGHAEEPASEEHNRDLDRIVEALSTDSKRQRARLLHELTVTPFLWSRNARTGEECFKAPSEIYFPSESLSRYFADNPGAWFLIADRYKQWHERLMEAGLLTGTVRVFRRRANVKNHVILVDQHSRHKRGLEGFDPITRIDGLDFALEHIDENRARFLWNALLLTDPRLVQGWVETSSRASFENSQHYERLSSAGKALVEAEWLPDIKGIWHVPSELALDDLPDDFIRSESLAAALGMRPTGISELARQAGISPDALRYALSNPEVFEALLEQSRSEPQAREDHETATTSEGAATPSQDGRRSGPTPRDSRYDNGERPPTGTSSDSSATQSARQHRGESGDRRLVSYVGYSSDRPTASDPRIEDAALEHVLQHERLAGREPRVMPTGNRGYDLESIEPDGEARLIEVKGLSGSWGAQGVTLTPSEFETAQGAGTHFWLYVVERARTTPRIYKVRDPARQVMLFGFDDGWKELSD